MSDIYVPGIKSRFNTEKLVEDLMKVERVPRDRAEQTVELLQKEKGWWQEVGNRLTALRDSSRFLYSFQNPFNDRLVKSSNEGALTGTARREASEQERSFTVKQAAQADRFLSDPLQGDLKIPEGSYAFSVGEEQLSFNFRGGTPKEFAASLNKHGRSLIKASLVSVKPGSQSLLLEAVPTGEANRLGLWDAAETLGAAIGLTERAGDSQRSLSQEALIANGGERASLPVDPGLRAGASLVLRYETAAAPPPEDPADEPPPPPSGPALPPAGSASYGGIVIENEPSSVDIPQWKPGGSAPAPRFDGLGTIALRFSDGTSQTLPPVKDSEAFDTVQYPLENIPEGKTITAIEIDNRAARRSLTARNIEVFDPREQGGVRAKNPVSTAQDAVIAMEGIEVKRPVNDIDDLIPGVTLTVRGPSNGPVKLNVEPDRQAVKDALISFVGNYNRAMAELNVLTRKDDRVVEELSYLSKDEQEDLRKRLGAFMGDSTLTQIRTSMQRIAGAPYPTSGDEGQALLAKIGIGTDVRRGGASAGFDQSRLRGYLEIDEKALDAAIQNKLSMIQELFGSDTNGDLIADTGVAFGLDNLAKPYVETGGIIALKTGNADTRIEQERKRIDTLDRQLASKEAELKRQYSQMEGAYSRMEQMSGSLDRFSAQNSQDK